MISMNKTRSSQLEMMREERNNTMPPEEMKEWNGMNGGKQDLERALSVSKPADLG